MSHVFLSYAREDVGRAGDLARALMDRGWPVWWDRKIPPGRSFHEVIERALQEAKCVIVLWSSASVASGWVISEAEEARRRDILIPALLEDVRLPLAFRWIECANLTDWRPALEHPEFDALVEQVARLYPIPLHPSLPERRPTNLAHHGPIEVPDNKSDVTNTTPSVTSTPAPRRVDAPVSGPKFVLQWLLVTLGAVVADYAVFAFWNVRLYTSSTLFGTQIVMGAILGWSQWMLLRKHIALSWLWIPAVVVFGLIAVRSHTMVFMLLFGLADLTLGPVLVMSRGARRS